ncbi:MAG TPA: METTL5 family protein [Chloroflexota bacterium]|nr:METTL5 family protein [Chloroflexota bacterium]
MKQRELEMLLQRVPPHPKPKAELEQYQTPAPIAADLVYRALAAGDITDKRVLDLGCGTGILGIGAALCGASHVLAADIDLDAMRVGEEAARSLGVMPETLSWRVGKVEEMRLPADTVLMNPPFGAQRPGADRPFHLTALACAPVVYTLVNAETLDWAQRFYVGAGARVTATWSYRFALSAQFVWHDKPRAHIEVAALRAVRA